ncbi:putative proteolipid membrane potential modulator [Plasmopara halstedii]
MGRVVDDADTWFEGDELFLQSGCNKDLAINGLLTLFGYIPGIVHAVYIICVG